MANLPDSKTETNILIVDDHPDNLRLLAKILESQGYVVRKSLNGRLALQGVLHDPPDLILLDITMPDMNGYEVCQHLKTSAATADIPIIFISALDQIDHKVRAFAIGGQDYITKPFQELEVLARVKNQLLIQQQQQQLMQQNHRLAQEMEERLKAEAEVRQLSLVDELTGLYNRRGFFLLAEQQLKMARRTQITCCLLFMDVDDLKHINDSFGRSVGDQLIIDIAQLLKQTFRDSDIIARLGGDEFVIFIPTGSSNVDDFYSRLETTIHHFNQSHNHLYQLSMSIGVTQCTLYETITLEQLVLQANDLMCEHKRQKWVSVHQ